MKRGSFYYPFFNLNLSMNNSPLYRLQVFILITFSIFQINCGKNNKNDNTKTRPPKTELTLPANNYANFDECDCHKEAMKILDTAIKTRTAFKSLDELKKNKESKKEIKGLAKTWQLLTKSCFQKNFARMFEPSDCNDLKSLEKKKQKLYDLGIQIDQGESIRL